MTKTPSFALSLLLVLGAATLPPAQAADPKQAAAKAGHSGAANIEEIGLLKGPKFKVEFLRVATEGDLAFVHTRQPKMGDNPEMVIVDIFRVANGKIAEHWDVMQAAPADAVNKRPMY